MYCKYVVINLLKNNKKQESLSCTRKTTPAVFGIRLIQHPLLEKTRGVCYVPHKVSCHFQRACAQQIVNP